MTPNDLLSRFLIKESVADYLHENSTHQDKVELLQHSLNDIGFGEQLNWERFGADGQYGRSTTRAVIAFAEQQDFDSDGKAITNEMLEKIIELKVTETSAALQAFLTEITTKENHWFVLIPRFNA